ncbi:MAG: hypothetical protein HKN26_03470 [Acidimicrobiales bacterium]|nr:hypothetical protein [Acidimicrobiales bacterium]
MALVNVKKKIEKAADDLGLRSGETVLAACTTNPSGTMTRMLSRELGGALTAAVAGKVGGSVQNPDEGMASEFVDGQNFLALTSERLLLVKVGVWTGKAKELLAEWPRTDVAAIQVDSGRLAHPLIIAFSDGTAVQVEGAKGTDPGAVADAFAA